MGKLEKDEDLGDVYELLGVKEDASEKDIKAAYRRTSKKCHPDKNPDDPEAAQKFDQLTRAKELLLDPARRGALDHKAKAKRDLEQRYSQETAKRRKLREDLESREGVAAKEYNERETMAGVAESAAEARKKHIQMDYAERIKKREAQKSASQAAVTLEAAEARGEAEDARVRVTWREGAVVSTEVIRKHLATFNFRSAEVGSREAVVQLGSRQDALEAVLRCRELRHQMPFRVLMAGAATRPAPARMAPAPSKEAPAPGGFSSWEADMLASIGRLAEDTGGVKTAPAPAAEPAATAAPDAPGGFDAWEAEMLAGIERLAETQTVVNPAPATAAE